LLLGDITLTFCAEAVSAIKNDNITSVIFFIRMN
jgi:hypothetical protein